jgi:hypothetical protein
MLGILEGIQAAYGHLPVAALQRVSQATGAWYATLYGTASYYGHLSFAEPTGTATDRAGAGAPTASDTAFLGALDAALSGRGTGSGAARGGKAGRP